MSRNLTTIALTTTIAVAAGILFGVWAGIHFYAGTETRLMREEAIAYGVARYNPTSGEFEYRIDMRAPISDYAPWRKCPLCQGEGVVPLPTDVPEIVPEPKTEEEKSESGDWM